MKAVNSYKVTFSDVSTAHMKMFLPFTVILVGDEVNHFIKGFRFEIERLTDEKRYWKCEYIVSDRVVTPSPVDWGTPHIKIECIRGKDTTILIRPPIKTGEMCEYGWTDVEIEMDIQNKMFTAGKTREEAIVEVFNGTVDDAMKRVPDDV